MAYFKEQRQYNQRLFLYSQPICLGAKCEPYYDNEDDYGRQTYNYKIEELSGAELDLLFQVINNPHDNVKESKMNYYE